MGFSFSGGAMNSKFEKKLKESLYIHFPLKEEKLNLDVLSKDKEVTHSVSVWDGKDESVWSFDGDGDHYVKDGIMHLHTWSRSDHWPSNEVRSFSEAQGKYTTFGSLIAKLDVSACKLTIGNRISFKIRPNCDGAHSTICRIGFVNDGKIKIPDPYAREGFHAMNLENHRWNDCSWEIDSIAHDNVTEISFNCHRYGKEVSAGDDLRFEIKDIRFDEVKPEVVHGWQCEENSISYSTTGYARHGKKTAVVDTDATTFALKDAETGETVFTGAVSAVSNTLGSFKVIDFSSFERSGEYTLTAGAVSTEPFEISDDIFVSTVWKMVNFLYSERCGYPVPEVHGTCHLDVTATHDGKTICCAGGWHDAADVSQQAVQTAEICESLLRAAFAVKNKDQLLFLRLLEEANWGIDYVLRMRFGDGFYAQNCSIRRWTDLIQGSMDDESADVDNRSLENFIYSAMEMYAAEMFAENDAELSWKLCNVAAEDYAFAKERFAVQGVEPYAVEQHTSSASKSQYYAAAAIAASRLANHSDGQKMADYVNDAVAYANLLISCQEQGDDKPMTGFFYCDEKKECIVHFTHQARDQIFSQALVDVMQLLPDSLDKAAYRNAILLHAKYIKTLASYASPYGLQPAGIYHISEADREEDFVRIHPRVVFEEERENYIEQLKNGISLGDGYYLRMMPVWFSFRGNNAILLSMGKDASILGTYLKDDELLDIAREQLYWTLGKNPFKQSLIYGEGRRYGRNYTALLKETVGEIAVGVQTRRNEDLPYWPPACVATYREVWTTPCGKWLSMAGDLL